MKKIVRVSDYCPETDSVEAVSVTFAEVRMVGNPTPGYKATGYSCTHASEYGCRSNGTRGGDCPLYRKAIREMA